MVDKEKAQLVQDILDIFKTRDVIEMTVTEESVCFKSYRKARK